MGRPRRVDVGGLVYHALNRASVRATLFDGPADYRQFEEVLGEAVVRTPMRLLAYCVMPNHWHLVLWPERDGQLSRFMTWLTLTHTQRWHARRRSAGSGHLYQGRYKSFLVEADDHLLAVCRYVERNPLRARLVRRGVALGEPGAPRARPRAGPARGLAGRPPRQLARLRQPRREHGRTGRAARRGATRAPLRGWPVVRRRGANVRPRRHPEAPRSAEAGNWFLFLTRASGSGSSRHTPRRAPASHLMSARSATRAREVAGRGEV